MSRPKKKFKDTTAGKILIGAVSLIPGVGEPLSEALSGSKNALEALQEIQSSQATPEQKQALTEMLLKADADEQKEITSRWLSDNEHGTFLARSVRPVLAFSIGIGLLVGWYLKYDLSNIMPLGLLVLGGYFGLRTTEKVLKK